MIVFARIDERLLHGQVVMKWIGEVNAKQVVIADDEAAANPVLVNLFTQISPSGVKVYVHTVEDAAKLLQTEEFKGSGTRVMILAKTPLSFVRLLDGGVELKELNVGNMGGGAGRKKIVRGFFYATDEEIAQLKSIDARGVYVYAQNICDMDSKKPLKKLVK
ncbi:MAG: PTS sugar transporter subunit IIB [Lachnospiraceae bacterium]|nr:PTS sugar transporter subunit IIB [Lachnospiraceae bacterium]